MSPLSSISGIGKTSLELLEVAGFLDAESLAKAGVDELMMELQRANGILNIAKRTPRRSQVEKWIHSACQLTGQADREEASTLMPVNYEGNPAVLEMIAAAPLALPFRARQLVEHGLAVGDIPPAIFLNRYAGDLEVRIDGMVPLVDGNTPETVELPQASGKLPRREVPSNGHSGPTGIDLSRVRSTTEFTTGVPRIAAPASEPDRVSILRAPLEKTNLGKNPESRRFIRGVLHSHPVSLWFGAFVTLLVSVIMPAAMVSALLLLLLDQMPDRFDWVPKWLLVFPVVLPVVGSIYFFLSHGCNCQICRQRLFWPRYCIKNSKAHHVPGLGYIIPLCFHILCFRWFRCTYCGTSVRLKK